MNIGLPKESKEGERRVALLPDAVATLVSLGAQVMVETCAGMGVGANDEAYRGAGAGIVPAGEAWRADLVVKVKEIQDADLARLPRGATLFSFQHLPGEPARTRALAERDATAIAFEMVRDAKGGFPLLAPMSRIAGRMALQQGREDLARVALERKKGVQLQLQGIDEQRATLQAEQDKLVLAEQRLTAKVEAFRTRKETIKAQYTAAEAQTKIGEAFSGVSEEMADVGMAIERAEAKTETMRARAGAIDELLESGALTDVTDGRDSIDRELEQLSLAGGVDAELERLRGEIGAGAPPSGQIEGGEKGS